MKKIFRKLGKKTDIFSFLKKIKPTGAVFIWTTLSLFYLLIFLYTGYYTFFVNNQFVSHAKNYYTVQNFSLAQDKLPLEDRVTRYDKSGNEVTLADEKEKLIRDLIHREADNFVQINDIAAQSFHIVLGSLLGFLSLSFIDGKRKKKKGEKIAQVKGKKKKPSSSKPSTKVIEIEEDGEEDENYCGFGWKWWVVLSSYCLILIFTGLVTFNFNNSYATQFPVDLVSKDKTLTNEEKTQENIMTNVEKVYLVKNFSQLDFLTELLNYEFLSIESTNSIASQSFTISLGALLGFFASTGTRLSRRGMEQ